MGCGSSQNVVAPQPVDKSSEKQNGRTLPKEELVVSTDEGNITPRKKKKNVLKEKAKTHHPTTDENLNTTDINSTVTKLPPIGAGKSTQIYVISILDNEGIRLYILSLPVR